MNIFKKIIKLFFDWPIVAISGALVVYTSWPWMHHVPSLMFAWIFVSVLGWEAVCYFLYKKTVSNAIRDQWKTSRFWVFIASWLLFGVILALHFCSKLITF